MGGFQVGAAPAEHLPWLVARTGSPPPLDPIAIEATDADRIVGMVAYGGWTKNACEAHAAVDTPIAWRSLVRPMFEYPFRQAGKGVLIASIRDNNVKSLDVAEHMG